MKSLILAIAFFGLFSGAAQAAQQERPVEHQVLLDCSFPGGAGLQGFRVFTTEKGELMVFESQLNGSAVYRPLPQEQWESKHLLLQADRGLSTTVVTEEGGVWSFRNETPGFSTYGEADCRRF